MERDFQAEGTAMGLSINERDVLEESTFVCLGYSEWGGEGSQGEKIAGVMALGALWR